MARSLIVVLVLAVCSTAAAASLPGVKTPSKNISCFYVPIKPTARGTLLCNIKEAVYTPALVKHCGAAPIGLDWGGFSCRRRRKGRSSAPAASCTTSTGTSLHSSRSPTGRRGDTGASRADRGSSASRARTPRGTASSCRAPRTGSSSGRLSPTVLAWRARMSLPASLPTPARASRQRQSAPGWSSRIRYRRRPGRPARH